MVRVILESPYKGDSVKNLVYGRRCVKDSLNRGESPIAPHLLYTQTGILDDDKIEERKIGMSAGLEWLPVAEKQVFYTDYGISSGMIDACMAGHKQGIKQEFRTIYKEDV